MTGLWPQGPWTVQDVPAAPLTLVGFTPLAGSRAWEGVVGENVQAGRGVGVDEARVHLPQYQATKILLGVPPYLPNVKKNLGPLQSLTGPQSPPCRSPCACRRAWGG